MGSTQAKRFEALRGCTAVWVFVICCLCFVLVFFCFLWTLSKVLECDGIRVSAKPLAYHLLSFSPYDTFSWLAAALVWVDLVECSFCLGILNLSLHEAPKRELRKKKLREEIPGGKEIELKSYSHTQNFHICFLMSAHVSKRTKYLWVTFASISQQITRSFQYARNTVHFPLIFKHHRIIRYK